MSAVLADVRSIPPAIVVASLLPLQATVTAASATITIDSNYPFGDDATIHVTATKPSALKVRIPGWADKATVDGKPAPNGTLVTLPIPVGNTTVTIALNPEVRWEHGWGDTLSQPPAASVAVVRGPLVFALHPKEIREVVRTFNTVSSRVAEANSHCAGRRRNRRNDDPAFGRTHL